MLASRSQLYRFCAWFFLVNTVLSLFIILTYIKVLPNFSLVTDITRGGVVLAWTFLLVSFLAQLSLLFFMASLLPLLLAVLYPRRWLVFPVAILLATTLVFGLIGDSMAFGLYHMHYAMVAWHILKAGAIAQVILLSVPERLMLLIGIVVLLVIESLLAGWVWRRVASKRGGKGGYLWAVFLLLVIVVSYALMSLATTFSAKRCLSPSTQHALLKAARIVPYYNEIYEAIMPGNASVRRVQTPHGEVYLQIRQLNHPLKYPQHALQCRAPNKPLNIVLIGIDTWRYDAMNKTVTPHIHHFAQRSLQFQNHWSGGNCTRPGMFSLFYGLPANYWRAFLHQRRGPVFIDQLLAENYELGIFTSAPLNFPAFDMTIFTDVKRLKIHTPGGSSVERDKNITREFQQFLAHRDANKPFFSFLFYDAVHNYCETQTPDNKPFQPAASACDRFSLTKDSARLPYVNRYHNAAYFVDGQVAQVLAQLHQRQLLKNTVVIITADHGEQINDEKMGYWDHASAYTRYQLQVPMLVYWPGRRPAIYHHMTTHYDLVPTLMQQLLACHHPASDYAIGRSLFSTASRYPLLAGSYADYAVVTKNTVTRIYPGGDYVINNRRGHHWPGQHLDKNSLQQALEYLMAYFHY